MLSPISAQYPIAIDSLAGKSLVAPPGGARFVAATGGIAPAPDAQPGDVVTISPEARLLQMQNAGESESGLARTAESQGADAAEAKQATDESQKTEGKSPTELTDEEEAEVQKLKTRDAEVRTHELAHKSAGGPYAGAINYSYSSGPDGRRYATGGEVAIDVSPVPNDPSATIQKMQVVKRAALAPAEPSGADRAVYANASSTEAQARIDLIAEKTENAEPPQTTGASAGESQAPAGAEPGGEAVATESASRQASFSVIA